jgi:type IV secretory pathway VirB2 component (pilin)
MLHPLFSTLIQRPDLLVAHISAYSALFQHEASQAGVVVLKRYLAWTVAGICAVVSVLFSGIALMLGMLNSQFHWVLLAVPGCALLLMLLAIAIAKAPLTEARFTELKAQIDSDIQALRSVS